MEIAPVVSGGKVFLQKFDLSNVIDFSVELSGQGPFGFVGEGFILGDVVGSSLKGKLSEGAAGLGEDDVEEFRIVDSAVSVAVVDLVEVAEVLGGGNNGVISQEVREGRVREGTKAESVDSLESGAGFEVRLFGKSLSGSFNVLFAVDDGSQKTSELRFGGKANHC